MHLDPIISKLVPAAAWAGEKIRSQVTSAVARDQERHTLPLTKTNVASITIVVVYTQPVMSPSLNPLCHSTGASSQKNWKVQEVEGTEDRMNKLRCPCRLEMASVTIIITAWETFQGVQVVVGMTIVNHSVSTVHQPSIAINKSRKKMNWIQPLLPTTSSKVYVMNLSYSFFKASSCHLGVFSISSDRPLVSNVMYRRLFTQAQRKHSTTFSALSCSKTLRGSDVALCSCTRREKVAMICFRWRTWRLRSFANNLTHVMRPSSTLSVLASTILTSIDRLSEMNNRRRRNVRLSLRFRSTTCSRILKLRLLSSMG